MARVESATALDLPEWKNSGVSCLQHFLHHGQGRRCIGIESAQAAYRQHQHVKFECNFHFAIVDDAVVAIDFQAVCISCAFMAARTNNIINLLAAISHI